MFVEKEDFETFKLNIRKSIRSKGAKMQAATLILTADFELKLYHRKVQFIDPGGANRIITLPLAYTLDGAPWFKPVRCQNCTCICGEPYTPHIYKEEFSADRYFQIYNTADAAEDLTIKFTVKNYTTQNVEFYCEKEEKNCTHDIPVFVDSEDNIEVMVISQNEGGIIFCNGAMWRGFLGGKT